mmetsp:Transcript_7504/g.21968  ORF Transcript_7504/g.21968 Transcript_7504/m.21968 type:complete len:237 (+) Transcript_7504:1257-1967(+)
MASASACSLISLASRRARSTFSWARRASASALRFLRASAARWRSSFMASLSREARGCGTSVGLTFASSVRFSASALSARSLSSTTWAWSCRTTPRRISSRLACSCAGAHAAGASSSFSCSSACPRTSGWLSCSHAGSRLEQSLAGPSEHSLSEAWLAVDVTALVAGCPETSVGGHKLMDPDSEAVSEQPVVSVSSSAAFAASSASFPSRFLQGATFALESQGPTCELSSKFRAARK